MASAKHYVVLHGAISVPDGDAVYQNAVVSGDTFGDQMGRHLKNGAIREATPAEVRAGVANATDEPTLEQQIEDEKAGIESAQARIKSLEEQIKARDAQAKKTPAKAESK